MTEPSPELAQSIMGSPIATLLADHRLPDGMVHATDAVSLPR